LQASFLDTVEDMPRHSTLLAVLSLGLGVAVASCAGPQGKDKPTKMTNADGETMICHQEYPTGSHIGRTVCRTEEEANDEREKARVLVSTPPPVKPKAPDK
jgi:hypothetical protein